MSGSNGNGRNGKPPPTRVPLFESDPDVRIAILQAVSDGMRDNDACLAAGIRTSTLREWKRRQGAAYDSFMADLRHARMEGKQARLRRIREAAEGKVVHAFDEDGEPITVTVCADWKADAWIMARMYPEEFSEKRILEHKGTISKGKEWREAVKDPDYRESLKAAARRRMGLQSGSDSPS